MTSDDAIAALDLPRATRVDRRVPKTLLVEHGAPTAADKRRISDGVQQIQWVAALKPTTIGVAPYRDDDHEYLEIAVLRVTLRGNAKVARLVELVHRAVPYPVLAVTELGERLNLSVVHKRWSQAEAGKTVVEGELVAVDAPRDTEPHGAAFLASLALNQQPRASLLTLYQGWIDAMLALDVARRTGRFEVPADVERRTARHDALRECARLELEMARLRAAAGREAQIPQLVELNLDLKRVEIEYSAACARL